MESLDSLFLHHRWGEVSGNGTVGDSFVLPSSSSYLQLNVTMSGTSALTKPNSGPELRPTWKEGPGEHLAKEEGRAKMGLLTSWLPSFFLHWVQSPCFRLEITHWVI